MRGSTLERAREETRAGRGSERERERAKSERDDDRPFFSFFALREGIVEGERGAPRSFLFHPCLSSSPFTVTLPDMSASPSRLLLTPPRLTPSPRRPLFETPARNHRAAGLGKWTAALVLMAVASASYLAGGIVSSSRRRNVVPLGTLVSAPSLVPTPIPGWGD